VDGEEIAFMQEASNSFNERGITMDADSYLWDKLLAHRGHHVNIVTYGDVNNPADVCLECEDCGEVLIDAELYTLCARGNLKW